MGNVITCINENGGVGKSSIIFNISWLFAKENRKKKSRRVLIIDMDGQQGNITSFFGIRKNDDLDTMLEVVMEDIPISDAILNVKPNLDIIPADNRVLDITETEFLGRMKKEISTIKNEYDYIFIDVGPNPDFRHALAMASSDYVIIVMQQSPKSLEGLKGITESLEEIKPVNPDLKVLGLLFNDCEDRINIGKEVQLVSEKMAGRLNSSVFKTKIHHAVVFKEYLAVRKGVTEYAPLSRGANDIRDLCEEIEERLR